MSRKKLSNNQAKGIARKRMEVLVGLSEKEALAGNMSRARRYMTLARRISCRNKVPMPPGALYCRRCSTPLVPGLNCRVRLRNRRVGLHCLECDHVRRRPYIMENRGNTCQRGL